MDNLPVTTSLKKNYSPFLSSQYLLIDPQGGMGSRDPLSHHNGQWMGFHLVQAFVQVTTAAVSS